MGLTNKQAFKRDELEVELGHELAHAGPRKTSNVKTSEVLAVASAAYRINKFEYIKDTRRFSTEENKTQFSNKEIVKMYFGGYKPDDYIPFTPTEEDYTAAEEIRVWMKRYVLLGLGSLPDFKRDMVEAASQDEVPQQKLGILAFIPEFVKRDKHESGLAKEIRVEYRDSKYLGKEKDNVNYTAVIDGNLVSFMNKYKHEQGTMKRIKAKIKALGENRLFGANETRLNYVKLFKV